MKIKNLEKLFDQFLVENDCFDEFMCEFHYQNTKGYIYLFDFHWSSLVCKPFMWVCSYQGYSYWENINIKWHKYLKENL